MAAKFKEPYFPVPFVHGALLCAVLTGLVLSLFLNTKSIYSIGFSLPDADAIPKAICELFSAKSVIEHNGVNRFPIASPEITANSASTAVTGQHTTIVRGVTADGGSQILTPGMPSAAEDTNSVHSGSLPTSLPLSIKSRRLKFQPIVSRAAHQYGIDPALVQAIIFAESAFDPNAVSKKGAMGLMQLMPRTAAAMGVVDCFDPEHNIFGGVRYFKKLITQFEGNTTLALAAYNAGGRHVRRFNGVPPFKATRKYVKKVLKYYDLYKKQMGAANGSA